MSCIRRSYDFLLFTMFRVCRHMVNKRKSITTPIISEKVRKYAFKKYQWFKGRYRAE